MPRAAWIEALNISCLGKVYSVVHIERPAHVPALWIGPEDPREREAEVDESSSCADGALRRNHERAAGIRPKGDI